MVAREPDPDLQRAIFGLGLVLVVCLLAWLLGGCSAVQCDHAFWQDQAGGPQPYVYSRRCPGPDGKPGPVEHVCRSSKPVPNEECHP